MLVGRTPAASQDDLSSMAAANQNRATHLKSHLVTAQPVSLSQLNLLQPFSKPISEESLTKDDRKINDLKWILTTRFENV